ncbi:MAG: nuclear transport factor 2 family protein [Hyphomicrobium sp.]|jgi:ketosteroid isomerase-like protein
MDSAVLLLNIYKCYSEKRLAEAVSLLSDDFIFKSDLPDDPLEPKRPRSRAELTLMAHKFLEEYDILSFEPGQITINDSSATVRPECTFRHKKSGKVLQTRFEHNWRIDGGKLSELYQRHDGDQLRTFIASLDDTAP